MTNGTQSAGGLGNLKDISLAGLMGLPDKDEKVLLNLADFFEKKVHDQIAVDSSDIFNLIVGSEAKTKGEQRGLVNLGNMGFNGPSAWDFLLYCGSPFIAKQGTQELNLRKVGQLLTDMETYVLLDSMINPKYRELLKAIRPFEISGGGSQKKYEDLAKKISDCIEENRYLKEESKYWRELARDMENDLKMYKNQQLVQYQKNPNNN